MGLDEFDRIKKYFRPLDVENLWGDSSKARKILGYEPKYDLETGLKETISWFQENYK